MFKFLKGQRKPPGLPPGSLYYAGPELAQSETSIRSVVYSSDFLEENDHVDVETVAPREHMVTWVSVTGMRLELMQKIGEKFGLHPLVLEDILNQRHRTKLEDYQEYLFLVLKWPLVLSNKSLSTENVSIVIGKNWVISFQQSDSSYFKEVLTRIRKRHGRVRKLAADYLGYALVDTLVDYYFPLIEQIENEVTELDQSISMGGHHEKTLDDLSDLKRCVLELWKILWAMRDLGNQIQRFETKLINKKTTLFFRDMQDHITHLFELSDMMRLRLDDLTNLYLSRINLHMNEVMKTLTIVGSIFIPLTFIAGVYGMNFKYMPELELSFGYPLIWMAMLILALGLLIYFRRKKWL